MIVRSKNVAKMVKYIYAYIYYTLKKLGHRLCTRCG